MDVARERLRAQRIASPARTPRDAVRALGAVQAQDYAAALWAVGVRTARATAADVERAIAAREIVRTWPMRGTLHFVAAEDARWMVRLLAPRAIARAARRLRELGLDDAALSRARKLLETALAGRALSRPALYRAMERAGLSPEGQRGIHVLGRLAQEGLVCLGPREAKQPTFVLVDEWLPPDKPRARDEALGELARRYVAGHGPATLADFAWWTGLSARDARAAMDLAAPEVAREIARGVTYYRAPRPSPAARPPPAVLLPAFDELMVGYKDRSAALDPAHHAEVHRGGVLRPALLVGARIRGTWRRALAPSGVAIAPAPFAPLDRAASRALADACARYAAFLGRPLARIA